MIPSFSRRSVVNDAAYMEFYNLTKFTSDSRKNVYWYMVVPSWVQDGLLGHNRLTYIYLDSTRSATLNNVVGFPALELARGFSRRGGRHLIDAVITDCSLFSAYLGKLLSDRNGGAVPVILREHGNVPVKDVPEDQLLLFANYVASRVAVRSEWGRSIVSRFIGKYLNPSMGSRFLDKSVVWPEGYNVRGIDDLLGSCPRGDVPLLFIGGDFRSSGKRRSLSIARKVAIMGIADVVLATTSVSRYVDNVLSGDSSFLSSCLSGLQRAVYLREVARCHCFVSCSDGDRYVDEFEDELLRLLMGQVGVFPHAEWVAKRVGADYPFFYNVGCEEEAIVLVEWIVNNFDDACARIRGSVDGLRERHDDQVVSSGIMGDISRLIDEKYVVREMDYCQPGRKKPLFSLVHDVAKGIGDEFSLDVFLDILEEHASWLMPWGRKGTLKQFGEVDEHLPTLYDLRQMLDNLGWIDQCDGLDVVVKRERDPLPEVRNGR